MCICIYINIYLYICIAYHVVKLHRESSDTDGGADKTYANINKYVHIYITIYNYMYIYI